MDWGREPVRNLRFKGTICAVQPLADKTRAPHRKLIKYIAYPAFYYVQSMEIYILIISISISYSISDG